MRLAAILFLAGVTLVNAVHASESHVAMPASVGIAETDEQGPVFVDVGGFTLYTYPGDDRPNVSNCNAERYSAISGQGQNPGFLPDHKTRPTCEQAWPPLRPAAQEVPVGEWKIFERHDGSRQWSYRGKPVYTSLYDKRPGDMTGTGGLLARTPLFAPPNVPPGLSARVSSAGYVLTRSDGMTLYTRADQAGPCIGGSCGLRWRPFLAPAAVTLAQADPRWNVEIQPDGSHQWTREGKQLFTYAKDRVPGDLRGLDESGWDPVVLTPPLQPPADITVQMTVDGEVFADKRGMTLYVWHCIDESPDRLPCDTAEASPVYRASICGPPEICINTWRPVVASTGSSPVGSTWTIIPVDPTGRHQYAPADDVEPLMVWAYKGKPVYTYAGDDKPGDIWGHKIRAFVRWGYSMIKADLSS